MIKFDSDFNKLYEQLSILFESDDTSEEHLVEAKYSEAAPINLADCRMISSDVTDIRGELEASACLDYKGELTRVQVRTVIIRETENGKEFLGRNYGRRISLPGGGYDVNKDSGDILNTAEREAYEEFNLALTNLKDTGIHVWSHRDDPWVTKHVVNEEDRWTGYYTFYVTADVGGYSDNDQPEEINKWQWLPIEKLSSVNSKVASFVSSLNEAIHPNKEGRTDIGEISYLCDSLSTLRKILSRMEIQKTYVSEVRYEVGEKDGNTCRKKQMSLSTSTNLTGHAERRADRWGFGVVLDGQVLSKYYDLEHYNHADHKLPTLHISKIARLKPGVLSDSRLIVALGEYGNRIISNKDNADMRLYELLIAFLRNNPKYLNTAKTLKNNYISDKDPTKWFKHPFGNEKNTEWCDARFTKLTVDQIEELFAWPAPFSKNAIPLQEIKKFDQRIYDKLINIFKQYTSFDEQEERIWVENTLMNFIQIPKPALTGIVLPDYFKEDFESDSTTNNHIAWLKQFVNANGLRVEWHAFSNPEYYKKEFEGNDTSEKELHWSNIDRIANDPETILTRAKMNKIRFMRGMIDKNKRENDSPSSVVATAAVRLAIEQHMQDLTPENYGTKYDEALAAAKAYYSETLVKGYLTVKPEAQLEDLFNYYCPDPPEATINEE
jgi:8-oxo-dGTP pyrophosphatase MutT (NUDIX family)